MTVWKNCDCYSTFICEEFDSTMFLGFLESKIDKKWSWMVN